MENLIFSLNATVPVFLVMVIGYILKNLKMMDEPFVKTLNKFNYNITLPLLLFQDIAGSDYNDVVNRVRGEVGSSITLSFLRDGRPFTKTITRRIVENITVEYKLLTEGTGKTGYIRISEFSAGTFAEFIAAYEALEAAGAEALVFDVRSNPGGNAEIVIAILEYILPDDLLYPIVRFNSRDGEKHYYTAEEYLAQYQDPTLLSKFEKAKDHEINMRMAVLCNEYTASAGELFTSCLMDFGVAETYGKTTYGKGLGQSSFRVTDYYAYAALGQEYFTCFEMGYFVIPSFYYSPPISDNYHEIGVVPHHDIALSEEAAEYYISTIPEALDNQLAAARDFVEGDTPFTPPPKAEGNTQTPPQGGASDEDGAGLSTPAVLFIVFFGVIVVGVIVLAVYLVVDYRRGVKRQSTQLSWDDQENDN